MKNVSHKTQFSHIKRKVCVVYYDEVVLYFYPPFSHQTFRPNRDQSFGRCKLTLMGSQLKLSRYANESLVLNNGSIFVLTGCAMTDMTDN